MKVIKVAVGNTEEAFIEDNFRDGVNIISSDENNKGKTIIIQSMMYAMGNKPTFPNSFEYKKYYYYVMIEEKSKIYQICRSENGFIIKDLFSIHIIDNISDFKRFWDKNISPLPTILKNQQTKMVDPELFVQLFFVGQDKKDTSNIANAGYYNKQDFNEMIYSYAGIDGEKLSLDEVAKIKATLSQSNNEKHTLLKQHKILKSKNKSLAYLSSICDRSIFAEKIKKIEEISDEISELRKTRNIIATRKSKWEGVISELNSLNRSLSCGELRCMDCDSKNISFNIGSNRNMYSFDVSTNNMRKEILSSINEKICGYKEELDHITSEINLKQSKLKDLIAEDDISLESIVLYKEDILSASDAEQQIKKLDAKIETLKNKLEASDKAAKETQALRSTLQKDIVNKMNSLYKEIDPAGNIKYEGLFTKQDEVYSGSEATVFHLVKLFALNEILHHDFPIIIDSFRAEDLSTTKERTVLEISKSLKKQVIFTTTLKHEELGKYDSIEGITHIDYQDNEPSKILSSTYVTEFQNLLSAFSLRF